MPLKDERVKMRRRAGVEGVAELVLAATATCEPRDDHPDDLVMLGTLAADCAFWPCQLWGAEVQRNDFVHVSRPCRGLPERS